MSNNSTGSESNGQPAEEARIEDVTLQMIATMGVSVRAGESLDEAFQREVNNEMTDERLKALFRSAEVSFSDPDPADGTTSVEDHGNVEELTGPGLPDGAVAIDRYDGVRDNPRVLVAIDSWDDITVTHEEAGYKIIAITPTAQDDQSTEFEVMADE